MTAESREDDPVAYIARHPAVQGEIRPGMPGFTLPRARRLRAIPVSEDRLEELLGRGIKIEGKFGIDNLIFLAEGAPKLDAAIKFHGHGRNTALLDPGRSQRLRLSFEGDGHLMSTAANYGNSSIVATFRGDHGALCIGKDVSCNSVNFLIEGPESAVLIGDDVMVSYNVDVRSSDSHAIVDLRERRVINPPKGVVIHAHVWLGRDAIVMPGCRIGPGSVIGARTIVTRDIPARSLAVGSPARVIREDVSWTRSSRPDEEAITALIASPLLRDPQD